MPEALRFYGQLKHLSQQEIKHLQALLEDFEVKAQNDELEFNYEGPYLDFEEYLQEIQKLLGTKVRGQIDIVDLLDWRMWRYVVQNRNMQGKEIPLNNVLEKYSQE